MSNKIKKIEAQEILDSRGRPTLKVEVVLENNFSASASVPSGTSTGRYEAVELRDGDLSRYQGMGVLKAVDNVNLELNELLKGMAVDNQVEIDQKMIVADGTPNKSKLGANAILGVSLALARTAANYLKLPLYKYLRTKFNFKLEAYHLPLPMMNIFNGGKHADNNLDWQELMIVPIGLPALSDKVRMGTEIFHKLGEVLKANNLETTLGIEGGYSSKADSAESAMDFIKEAIVQAGYEFGKDVSLALDAAASAFYDGPSGNYYLSRASKTLTSEELISFYESLIDKYKIISIEDGLADDDWAGWQKMTYALGREIQLVGDDLFVTNKTKLKEGIDKRVANAIIIKPNQAGTLTETMETIKLAQTNGYKIVVSHRSGETTDPFIADLAVAVNADYLKAGSSAQGERLAKYNRLMEIEKELEGLKK